MPDRVMALRGFVPRSGAPGRPADARTLPSTTPPTTIVSRSRSWARGTAFGRYSAAVAWAKIWRAFDLKLRVDVALKALHQALLLEDSERALETLAPGGAGRSGGDVSQRLPGLRPGRARWPGAGVDGVHRWHHSGLEILKRERSPWSWKKPGRSPRSSWQGLEAIHQAGLVHRDVKPENIMLTRSGRVVVMDFGVAKRLADKKLGTVAGTPAYMAPEQVKGQQIDARADVFSAGVVLAEMIAPEGSGASEAREKVWRGFITIHPSYPTTSLARGVEEAVTPSLEESAMPSASVLARALEEVTLRIEGSRGGPALSRARGLYRRGCRVLLWP